LLRVRVSIDICHDDSDVLAAALNPDDLSWARCWFDEEKGRLSIEVESRIESVIAAVDDFMINLKAAVSVLEALASVSDRESCR